MASWPSIVILFGLLTILEFVGKCVPVIDSVIESGMTFVVPILSILGSMSAWGLFTASSSSSNNNNPPDYVDVGGDDVQHGRRLSGETGGGFLIFLQVCLCIIGIFLALLVHLCKLLLRLMGEGCCTCCITFCEYGWIIFSVIICIFIVPIAIGAACCLIVAAGFGFKHWLEKRRKKKMDAQGKTNVLSSNNDEEHGQRTDNEEGHTEKGTAKSEEKETSKEDLHQPLLAS